MTRKQFFYLNLLEPPSRRDPGDSENDVTEPRSPLEVIVHQGCLDLIMHPVILKLILTKWSLYGRSGAWLLLTLNFLFIVSWTTVAISISDTPKPYVLPQDWWRVLLLVVALLLLGGEVLREVNEILSSRRKLLLWKRNIFDWLVYCLLAAAMGVHLANILHVSPALHATSLRLLAVTIVFLWLRLLKHVRAFRVMGPFIVMLGEVVGDVMRFLFLYVEIVIPYACAFWIIFGGLDAVSSMRTFPTLLYSLYRMTLMDEYQFDAMGVMTTCLCARVYDNAQANAVMQQAAVILQVEDAFPCLRHFHDNNHIHRYCAPIAEFYDHDHFTNS
ncbi:hypothetical protein CRUP_015915, partial [Coryphaenoides rupestris]